MRKVITILAMTVVIWLPGKVSALEPSGERMQDLNLTNEQEAKIAEIRSEFHPRIQEAARELATVAKAEVDKIRATLTPAQRGVLDSMKEERREHRAGSFAERVAHLHSLDLTDAEISQIAAIRKEFNPKIAAAMEGLRGILTEKQQKAREEALQSGMKRRQVIASLNLTDAQKQKVQAVGSQLRNLAREEMDKIRDVLSEEQRQKLQEFKAARKEHIRDHMAERIVNLKDLNLTDQQKSEIAAIRKEFRPKVQEAGNKLRAEIRQELAKVVAVLTGN
jgi:Spy/CpxP family protein refolding chaperone